MADPLTTIGAGTGGTIVGAVLAFFGFKGKLGDIDKRIDRIENNTVSKNGCTATKDSFNGRFDDLQDLMKESRDDIKVILGKIK